MRFRFYTIFALGVFGILVGLGFMTHVPQRVISINGQEMTVLLADRAYTQRKGLGGYSLEELAPRDGMLFTFSSQEERFFWMKNMEFPLDIVWIREGRIVAIDRNIQPPLTEHTDPEKVTSAPLRVDMVLEVPAGTLEKYGISEGMTLILPKN